MAPTNEKVSNNIPDDVAFNILSKLPVKSLKRFRCVHKCWSNLFENPHFMSMYRQNFISKDDDSCILLKQQMPSIHRENLFLLSGERFEKKVKLDWPPPFQEDDRDIFILGSCINGTICLYQGSDITGKVVLWKPATEEFKVIPFSPTGYSPGLDILIKNQGFGYDHVRDDYKVIQYVVFFEDDYEPLENYPNVPEPFWQIYSQKSNCWKKLDTKMTICSYQVCGNAVYLNGVSHWWGSDQQNQETEVEDLLVSFDMSNEVFHTTLIGRHDCYELVDRHLAVFNGSIAMITNVVDNNCFDISILGEVGVDESWIKLFTFRPLPCIEKPIGVGKKGDIFFRKNDDELVWFDLSTNTIGEIGVKGEAYSCQIVIYKESLLLIGGIYQ